MVLWSGSLLAITLLLLHKATAGFSCVSNPCVYGICIDNINSSYTCYCIDGYTGVHCQTNWDECWSSPCLNGGHCHDGVASYNCSCPEGFVGDFCEENVDECSSSPCHNNGTCVDATNSFSCQCDPGYSGHLCEIDVAVCNSTEDMRCNNGGVCIEGPGIIFSCFCRPGWMGKLCEIPIDECSSNPCQNGAVCIDLPASYSCACMFGFTGRDCDLVLSMCPANPCENDAVCLVEDDTSVCYCVPDYHGDRCQYQYDECLLGPGCKNGGSCIDGVDSFTCSCPPDLTGQFCECLILGGAVLDCSYVATSTTTSTTSTLPTTSSVPTTQLLFNTEEFFTTLLLESSPWTTSPQVTTIDDEPSSITTTTTEVTTMVVTTTEPQVTEQSTDSIDSKMTTELIEATTDTKNSTITKESVETIGSTEGSWSESKSSVKETESNTIESVTGVTLNLKTTEAFAEIDTASVSLPPKKTTDQPHTEISFPVYIPDQQTTTRQTIIPPTEVPTTMPPVLYTTSISTTSEMQEDTTTVRDFDCTKIPCLNGGVCLISPSGPKCKCKQGWRGDQCERRDVIQDAAFTGHSYVSHRLANHSGTAVSVVVRTLAATGMLIHANTAPNIYLAVYLHKGLLKFVFSCGIQTMLFSELHDLVNTGFPLSVTAMLEVEGVFGSMQHCFASLTVNNSVVMSGEQRAVALQSIDWSNHLPTLYLGGVPIHLHSSLDLPVTQGITGCMNSLQVDGVHHKIFADAVDMVDVSQCWSLACLSSPCHGAATCIERADTWACLCPSGFVGPTCEQSVCQNNPCHFGGSCAPYPGSGFICLCPTGKHGLFCHKDLEIGQPLYTSSVRGLSSFSSYPLPGVLHHSFEMRFHFITQNDDQVALLLFIGQEHDHDSSPDHIALSYIKGYVVLTWNLGSGPRRIFTPRPVHRKVNSVHTVKFGRVGQQAWLQVDNLENVTGTSPGMMTDLNTHSIVYIGGHKNVNFTKLPHDLPLHTGFTGCVYDLEFRAGRVSVMVSDVRAAAVEGRNVGQCGTSHCHNTTCLNGGACLDHGATFTCLCKDGWFGPVCAQRYNPCDHSRHNCSHGATCVPLETGYQCDCPFGRIGDFCEREEVLTDISFKGQRSYLALAPSDLHIYQMCIEFELKPNLDRGLVLFSGHPQGLTFMSIALHGGIMELRLYTVGSKRKSGEVLVVRSGRVVSLASWHLVRAGRYGNRVFLWVDGAVTAANLQSGEALLPSSQPVFIGGVPDLSQLPHGAMAGLPVGLSGCVRQVNLNWRPLQLTTSFVLSARNLEDCDGTACGGDVCLHKGTCWLDTMLRPHCTCTQEYTGERCQSAITCADLACSNGGQCLNGNSSKPTCQCPTGWEGPFCSQALPLGPPHFVGDSYMMVDPPSMVAKRGQNSSHRHRDIHSLSITFSTAHPNGLILWTAKGDEYVGLGVEEGLVKLAWSWQGKDSSVLTLVGPPVADGDWHELAVNLSGENVTVRTDRGDTLSYFNAGQRPVTTDGIIYLGGFPQKTSVNQETHGIYKEPFRGCLREVGWNNHSGVTDFSKYRGQNIRLCPVY